ncbi:MAG TPA: alpha/beta hydrolase-fold protein, partial [Polyangiaceae bacterium]|nr:alpha/beta hydrolase-fold protein [Polyangiaceae bacterium]
MRRLCLGLLALGFTLSCGRVTSGSGSAPATGRSTGAAQAGAGGGAGSEAGADNSYAGDGSSESGAAGSSNLEVLRSSGCGSALPPSQVATIPGSRTGYTEFFVDQTGATLTTNVPSNAGKRQFFVRVPSDYDSNRPYRVVYIGSGCGTLQAAKISTYPLFNEAQGGTEQAVYVALSVPDNAANPGCYDNSTGPQSQEWEAFALIHAFVESKYCVDNNRVYVAGYSTGGWLANMWGCYFAGTASPPLDQPDLDAGRSERKFAPHWAIRGHLNVTGSLPPNQPLPCNG